jgi:hypothetical protein
MVAPTAVVRPFVAGVQGLQVAAAKVIDVARAFGRPLDPVVVHQHQLAVGGDVNVHLRHGGTGGDGIPVSEHRLARPLPVAAAVRDDLWALACPLAVVDLAEKSYRGVLALKALLRLLILSLFGVGDLRARVRLDVELHVVRAAALPAPALIAEPVAD